jgi:hypothetical protein
MKTQSLPHKCCELMTFVWEKNHNLLELMFQCQQQKSGFMDP